MKIFNSLEEIETIEETVIALGNFDGVHKGHQQIISRTVKSAEAAGFKSAVFTFSNPVSYTHLVDLESFETRGRKSRV